MHPSGRDANAAVQEHCPLPGQQRRAASDTGTSFSGALVTLRGPPLAQGSVARRADHRC